MNKAIIALNGELVADKADYKKVVNQINNNNIFVLAADGGARLLDQLGFLPDTIIGDLDSLSQKQIKYFEKKDIEILEYPVEKNETDGELALKYCKEQGYDNVIIIGAVGGRFDQQLANIYLLEYALENNLKARIKEPGLEIGLVNKNKIFKNKNGWGLSLIPLDQTVNGVSISGCKYNLDYQNLTRFKTRGISNLITEKLGQVSHDQGRLLYILHKNN